MGFIQWSEQLVRLLADRLPLDWFVFVGSFIEEVISPIPSLLIMGTAGTIAMVQHRPLIFLFWLAVFGNTGKTLGAWVYYFVGDQLEDVIVRRFGKYFGVTHTQIEGIGKRFTGHHLRDGGFLFLLRFFPFIPTTPVSIGCGIVKMDIRVFLLATYLGNILKDIAYLYAGYYGVTKINAFWHHGYHFRPWTTLFVVVLFGGIIYLFTSKRHRQWEPFAHFKNWVTGEKE